MKIGAPTPGPYRRLVAISTSTDEIDHVPVDLSSATDGDVLTYVAADGALELLPPVSPTPSWTRFFLVMGG